MKIGVTGTKKGLSEQQKEYVLGKKSAMWKLLMEELHHGDCIGVDAQVHSLLKTCGFRVQNFVIIHPPQKTLYQAWCAPFKKRHKPKPYLVRNRDIVDETEFLIAFPKGYEEELRSGTWACVRYARKKHKTILFVFPDGTLRVEDNR